MSRSEGLPRVFKPNYESFPENEHRARIALARLGSLGHRLAMKDTLPNFDVDTAEELVRVLSSIDISEKDSDA